MAPAPKIEKPFTLKLPSRKPELGLIVKLAPPEMLNSSVPEIVTVTVAVGIERSRLPFGCRETWRVPAISSRPGTANRTFVPWKEKCSRRCSARTSPARSG